MSLKFMNFEEKVYVLAQKGKFDQTTFFMFLCLYSITGAVFEFN